MVTDRMDFLNLPDPTKDPMPPMVMASESDIAASEADKKAKSLLLDPKKDTEEKVLYVLTKSPLFGARLTKDGDWMVNARGRSFFSKKITDYRGSIKQGNFARSLYVEVKGVSPGKNFNLSRIDKANRKGQKSQCQKLQDVVDDGCLAWIAIGWWDAIAGARPVYVPSGGRTVERWKKEDVELTISLIPWNMFADSIYPHVVGYLGMRSIQRKELETDRFKRLNIKKVGSRWVLPEGFWWRS